MSEPIRIKVPVVIELDIEVRPVMAVNKISEENKPEEKFFKEVLKIKRNLETQKKPGRPKNSKNTKNEKGRVETATEKAKEENTSFTAAYKSLYGTIPGGADIRKAREVYGYVKQRNTRKTKPYKNHCECGRSFKQTARYLQHIAHCDGDPKRMNQLKKDNEYMKKTLGEEETYLCFLCNQKPVKAKDDLCEDCDSNVEQAHDDEE